MKRAVRYVHMRTIALEWGMGPAWGLCDGEGGPGAYGAADGGRGVASDKGLPPGPPMSPARAIRASLISLLLSSGPVSECRRFREELGSSGETDVRYVAVCPCNGHDRTLRVLPESFESPSTNSKLTRCPI